MSRGLYREGTRQGLVTAANQTGVNNWTPELEEIYGLPPGGFRGTRTAFKNLVYPDDRAGIIALNNWALKTRLPTRGEWRVVWPDGRVHWVAGRWQVFMNEVGEPSRMIGVNIDVIPSKQAEEALADMTRKFIDAQEQERSRIGRELHGDVNQPLAMLVADISNDVQALSRFAFLKLE